MDSEVKPPTPAKQFGQQLAFYRKQCRDPEREGGALTQERLAELLGIVAGLEGYDGRRISRWERGKDTIPHDYREFLVGLVRVLHQYGGIGDRATADKFLQDGLYSPLTKEEAVLINPTWQVSSSPWRKESLSPPTAPHFLLTVEDVLGYVRQRLPYPEAHFRTPRGVVIWVLRGLPYLPWGKTAVMLALWWLTYQLLAPALQWPIPDLWRRVVAYSGLAAVHVVVPPLLAILITPDNAEQFIPQDDAQRRTLFFLKWVGSLAGLVMLSLALWLLGLFLYYMGWGRPWIGMVGAGMALFMGFVSGGRIPIDRYKMYEGKLQAHPGDAYVALVFLAMPLVLMGFVLVAHDVLANPHFGGAAAVAVGGTVLWMRRTEFPAVGDGYWLGLMGVGLPAVVWLFLWGEFAPPVPTWQTYGELGLALAVVQSLWLYGWAQVLWVRGWVRAGLGAAVLVGAIVLSVWLVERVAVWVDLGGFVVVVGLLVGWVYAGRK